MCCIVNVICAPLNLCSTLFPTTDILLLHVMMYYQHVNKCFVVDVVVCLVIVVVIVVAVLVTHRFVLLKLLKIADAGR